MDCGEKVVRFDNVDGDGALGYGHNGTLSWADTWTTAYDAVPTHPNDGGPATYTAQFSGNLAEITDSVFFNNSNYTDFDAVGANDPSNNNVIEPATMPIASITTLIFRDSFKLKDEEKCQSGRRRKSRSFIP